MTTISIKQQNALLDQIAERAAKLYESHGIKVKAEFIRSEVAFTHDRVCKLRLADLAAADDFNLLHDVGGIHGHLDMRSEVLRDCFSPRFSAR